jgi:hypothetical protein
MAQEVITTVSQAEDGTKFLVKTRVFTNPQTGKKQFQPIGTSTLEQIDTAIAALEIDKKLLS